MEEPVIPVVDGYWEATRIRRNEVIDIAKRLAFIAPHQLRLQDLPLDRVVAVFNTSLLVDNKHVYLYPRIVAGYYRYVSAIAEARVAVEDLFSGSVGGLEARIIIRPSTWYDFWGAEDPRAYRLGGWRLITYTGRTANYFNDNKYDKVLPVTAVERKGKWAKVLVTRPAQLSSRGLISSKNAFIAHTGKTLYLFHRAHTAMDGFILAASKLPEDITRVLESSGNSITEYQALEDYAVMPSASFEEKIGWATPPIRIGGREILVLLHGVSRSPGVYRVFAALLETDSAERLVLAAVTPRYVMEPRLLPETYGDRPYTVFPCGAQLVGRELLVSYGAADTFTGIAVIPLDELLGELDRGRIF